ncbi:haloacid dehalogenase type II [Rhodospira trueperi]|uniref:(S)-2-haloacid dehalogenase n=1 Tax=Rhodospira trueperi TaxID=69960 RepID=A0A1G7GF98_9PROT|nr:haloacid dehalogenase type II [Rhodospira trueperi]SDE86810.1 2-haloacid dehalogenase [Rhodospira trueperi]
MSVTPQRPVACLFDAYGTLFDVTAAARHLKDEIGPSWEDLAETWRVRQVEYTWLRSLMDRYTDFRAITAEALDYALDATGQAPSTTLRDRLMGLYMTLDAYPEVPAVLAALRDRGIGTAILSNGSPDMLKAACDSAGLTDLLDAVLSVDAVGIFKPAAAAYDLGRAHFGTDPERVMFVSSNGWDVAGAASFGYRTVWVNRRGAPAERLPGCPVAELDSLDRLPDLLRDLTWRGSA